MVMGEERPEIPEFVLPKVRDLIRDCWKDDPDDRPRFAGILERLQEMRWKLTAGVKSAKVAAFVERMLKWERENGLADLGE
jgi:hypothetical protein